MGKGSKRKTRYELLKSYESNLIELPPTEDRYIITLIEELGWYTIGMNGINAMTWQEMHAWTIMTGTVITMYESNLLMALSKEFVSQYNKSDDRNAPPPYSPPVDKEKVSSKVASVLGGFKRKQ